MSFKIGYYFRIRSCLLIFLIHRAVPEFINHIPNQIDTIQRKFVIIWFSFLKLLFILVVITNLQFFFNVKYIWTLKICYL